MEIKYFSKAEVRKIIFGIAKKRFLSNKDLDDMVDGICKLRLFYFKEEEIENWLRTFVVAPVSVDTIIKVLKSICVGKEVNNANL